MEIPEGDKSATAMQERGPNLHRYNHDFYLAVILDVLPQLSAISPSFQIQLLSYCWFSHSFCHTLYNVTSNWCS